MITIHQRYRQTDRQTTSDRNTALCTKVHRAVKTSGVTRGPVGRLRRNRAKHGVKTLNRDRDSLKEEQKLCCHLKYEKFCDLGLSESPMLKSWMDLGFSYYLGLFYVWLRFVNSAFKEWTELNWTVVVLLIVCLIFLHVEVHKLYSEFRPLAGNA